VGLLVVRRLYMTRFDAPDSSLDSYHYVPLVLIAGVVAMAIVVELFGGVIFDGDVNTVSRSVFRQLDEMVAEMEELRG
jgi:hypothetical protein